MKLIARRVAFLLTATAVPVMAQQADPPPLATELPVLKMLGQIDGRTTPAARLTLFDQALAKLVQPTPFRGRVLCSRALTLQQAGRLDEAVAGFEQCRLLRPTDPFALLVLAFAKAQKRQPIEAAQLIMRAAAISPDAIRQVDPATMDTVVRQLRYVRENIWADKLTGTLAATGWARDNAGVFSRLATRAVRHRLTDGKKDEALAMLPTILSPRSGVEMLIDRRYASIWPQVEAWAGSDLSVQRQALLDSARGAYETSHTPDDFLAYVAALEESGHRDDAVVRLRQWLATDSPRSDHYYANMAVVKLGRMLAELGNRAEGIDLMKGALAGPDARDESVVNIVPNLVIQQLLAGDYTAALAVLDSHTPADGGVEASAAIGYFVALRACALHGAGQTAAADEALARVQSVFATNDDAVDMATNCVGSPDAQAARWITSAEKEDRRGGALLALADARYRQQRGLPAISLDDAALRTIAGRADVRAAYDRLGRDLPTGYRPALVNFDDGAGR